MTENRGIPRSIVITSKPTCPESWWVGKSRDQFSEAWKQRVPLMKLAKADAFKPSGVELAD